VWQARWLIIKGSPRAILLGLLILCVFGVFSWRLWYLQFVQGEHYCNLADIQRLGFIAVPAPRGIIYDRDGTPLVYNIPSFKVAVTPAYLPDDEDEAEYVLIRLAILLDMPYTTSGVATGEDGPPPGLRDILHETLLDEEGNEASFSVYHRPVVVKRGVARDKALLIILTARWCHRHWDT
jgi:cell division protein FtsI/penicillin-binding protein 2